MQIDLKNYYEGRLAIDLVGCGGNGTQMLSGLARMNMALIALGRPAINVTVYDPDDVTTANVGRQLFSPSDIGQNKAIVSVHRMNLYFGTNWKAVPKQYGCGLQSFNERFLISCVDSAEARRSIHENAVGSRTSHWLDMGNRRSDGQVVFGLLESWNDLVKKKQSIANQRPINEVKLNRLPHVMDIFPELLDPSIPEDNRPSCSLAEALEQQDLFVNQSVVTWALHLLWTVFRYGEILHHGYFINLADGTVNPLPVPALPAKGRRKKSAAA